IDFDLRWCSAPPAALEARYCALWRDNPSSAAIDCRKYTSADLDAALATKVDLSSLIAGNRDGGTVPPGDSGATVAEGGSPTPDASSEPPGTNSDAGFAGSGVGATSEGGCGIATGGAQSRSSPALFAAAWLFIHCRNRSRRRHAVTS